MPLQKTGTLCFLAVLLCATPVVARSPEYMKTPPPPAVLEFDINEGDDATMYRNAGLYFTAVNADFYRVSEDRRMLEGLPGLPFTIWPGTNYAYSGIELSEGNGVKTVYLQVGRKYMSWNPRHGLGWRFSWSPVAKDTIRLIQPDPRITRLSLSINRTSGREGLEVGYEIHVAAVPQYWHENLSLTIEATGYGYICPQAQTIKAMGYRPFGRVDPDDWVHRGKLSFTVPSGSHKRIYRDQCRCTPRPKDLTILERNCRWTFLRASIHGTESFAGDKKENNSLRRAIGFSHSSKRISKKIEQCEGAGLGSNGDWSFYVRDTSDDPFWVRGNEFSLSYCGPYNSSDEYELRCDNDEINPLYGESGIKWVKRPTTDSVQGKIHWWCEPLAVTDSDFGSDFKIYVTTTVETPEVCEGKLWGETRNWHDPELWCGEKCVEPGCQHRYPPELR